MSHECCPQPRRRRSSRNPFSTLVSNVGSEDTAGNALAVAALAHLAVAVLCLAALAIDLRPIQGIHPASKPLKFALSIGLMLWSMSVLVPALSVTSSTKNALAAVLVSTMVVEMIVIVAAALRHERSHFNLEGKSAIGWFAMMAAIVVATVAFVAVAWWASSRPLGAALTPAMTPAMTAAWRFGLWLLVLSAVSGFAMGGRLSHSVGGVDGGPGLPIANWSRVHGDLRVSHFIALHGLQALPVVAWLGDRAASAASLPAVVAAGVVGIALVLVTLAQALAGRPLL